MGLNYEEAMERADLLNLVDEKAKRRAAFKEALRESRMHNEALIAILKQILNEEELTQAEKLTFERADGEVWELVVADAVPTAKGVRLMGEARRVK